MIFGSDCSTKALAEKLLKMPKMNDMQLWEDTLFDVQLGFHDDDWHIATGRCKCGEDIHDAVRYSTERQALEAAYIRQCFGDTEIESFDECEDCRLNGKEENDNSDVSAAAVQHGLIEVEDQEA